MMVKISCFLVKVYPTSACSLCRSGGGDLLLTIDDRKVAVQLKRYTAPVGNAAVQAVFAGMSDYKAKEAWVITTSSFTKSAVELAKSTRVRLIDGKELEDWLDDLRDEF
jgi:restriction system protein